MAKEKQAKEVKNEVPREDRAVILKKLEIVVKLREAQVENARVNLDLFKRGLATEINCW